MPSRLAILDQGKMIFLVPFLSSTGEMFVVCPKEQLQSGVGGATREVPCPSGAPRLPAGSVLRPHLHPALPVVVQSLPPPHPLSARGRATRMEDAGGSACRLWGGEGASPAAALTLPQPPAFVPIQQETSTPGLGVLLLILAIWSFILMYLCFNSHVTEAVLPT